jgi:hypothetical protein
MDFEQIMKKLHVQVVVLNDEYLFLFHNGPLSSAAGKRRGLVHVAPGDLTLPQKS